MFFNQVMFQLCERCRVDIGKLRSAGFIEFGSPEVEIRPQSLE